MTFTAVYRGRMLNVWSCAKPMRLMPRGAATLPTAWFTSRADEQVPGRRHE